MRASLIVLCLLGTAVGSGEPVPSAAAQDARAYDEKIKPFLAKHCVECHGPEKVKGKTRLDTLSPDFTADATRRKWLTVREQMTSENMPPKAKPRPAQGDIDALIRWIDGNVVAVDLARQKTHGRAVLRRLNRVEYENTVRDLFSIQNDLQDLLPADTSAHGFDNVGEALHSSSFLMERYLEAADTALNAAIVNIPKPWQINKRFNIKEQGGVKLKGDVYRPLDDGAVAIFSSWISANICVTMWNFQARFPGKYKVKISGYGFQSEGRPVTFYVLTGTMKGVTEQRLVNYYDVPAGTPTVVEFSEHMEPGFTIRIVAEGLPVTPPTVTKVGAENYKGPGLALQWVEVEGPILENWPPPSHRGIFGDLPQAPVAGNKNHLEVVSTNPAADAERVIRNFARRAFRRAVTDDDLKPILARVKSRLADGYTFEQAVRVGLKMVLVSPDFLFLRETPGKLDDFALASRLSYFLWSSTPDEELLALAAERKLSQPDTLRKQVERLLQDPKAASFTQNFAGQWLSLRAIDDTMPDPTLYPEFKDALKESMAKEPVLFFDDVLKNDLSLTNFVASDFSVINGPLAEFYRIPGVEGREFRKVTLPAGSRRGGVLTMAAVLKVTANGTNTSPILRGAWVLERILGTPPPKPTVDVEAVEPDIRGATTIREQLAKHRNLPECATCHQKIDPPGFALENFDVIGGWRENYRSVGKGEVIRGKRYKKGPPVEAADVLPDGRRFKDIDEYKKLLLQDKDQLARALAEKLLVYATGASPSLADHSEIEAIVRAVQPKNYGFRTLVHEIVQSKVFQHK